MRGGGQRPRPLRGLWRGAGGGPRAGTGPGGRAGPGLRRGPWGSCGPGTGAGVRRPPAPAGLCHLPAPQAGAFPLETGGCGGSWAAAAAAGAFPGQGELLPPPRPGGGGPGGKEPVPAPAAVPGVPACRDLGRRSRGLPWRAAAGSGAACGVWLLRVRRPPPQQGTASGAAGGAVPELLTPADASVLPGWRLGFALEERSGCRLAVSTSWF